MNIDADAEDLFPMLWEAQRLENNATKCSLLEEIIRLADLRQDAEIGFQARYALVDAGTFSGAPDKALVAFSWCLSQVDKNPEQFSEEDLMWKYKWITDSLPDFPQISKKQIDDMLDDMRTRYLRRGSGEYPVVMLRWKMAMRMGDKPGARKWYAKLQTMPRSHLADCAACVKNSEVHHACVFGQDEKALEIAAPILSGQLRCSEVPHMTYGHLLLPMIRLKRFAEAVQIHKIGYRISAKSGNLLRTIADHLLFLGLTENHARAVKMFERHFSWMLDSTDFSSRFEFLFAGRFLMERLSMAETTSVKARLPRAFVLYQEGGRYGVPELLGWLTQEAADLGQRFDDRNGTDYFSKRLKGMKKLHGLATAFPV